MSSGPSEEHQRPILVCRNSDGVTLNSGPLSFQPVEEFEVHKEKINCRAVVFSNNGKLLAWTTGLEVNVLSTITWKKTVQLPAPNTYFVAFSPKGTFLSTFTPYHTSPDNPQGFRNMKIWKTDTGEEIAAYIMKKQALWKPQWTDNEQLMARRVYNKEVNFYEDMDFKKPARKADQMKIENFSLAPGNKPNNVAFYVPGSVGQPSFVRLFEYPSVQGHGTAIANITLFKGDHVDLKWNARGTALLALASTEVDKEGNTYYGQTYLYMMDITGTTANVLLDRETGGKGGPIYSVEWSPSNREFCVVYGFMPARASVFNLKCERIFDFGEGKRNAVYYNSLGNMIILAGFGNLRGNVEVWDVSTGDKPKQVCNFQASDSTDLKWDPTGEWIMTCTTSPRLRIANGVCVWHCSGKLMHRELQEELYEVIWQPVTAEKLKPVRVTRLPYGAAKPIEQPKAAPAYVPPQLRNKTEEETQGEENTQSKNYLRNKKKKEAKKAAKEARKQDSATSDELANKAESGDQPKQQVNLTGDPEKDKIIRKIGKKLNDIQKLKAQQSEGKRLDGNQMAKVKSEQSLIAEFKNLMS